MTLQEIQLLHIAEEMLDKVQDNGMAISESTTSWDARYHRITNLLDPQNPEDAVTLRYITANKDSFINAIKSTATGYIETMTGLKDATATSEANAKTSEINAKTSETNSKSSENMAKAWAVSTSSPDNAADTDSPTGKTQSSKSWSMYVKDLWNKCTSLANSAKESMTNASSSANAAKTSETNAKTSEINAKSSEDNAKKYFDAVQNADVTRDYVQEQIKNTCSSLIHAMYPVGSYIYSDKSANPSTYLPYMNDTTWTQTAQGRVLVGQGTGTDKNGTSQTFAAGSTGGEFTHKLTVEELPAHTHNYRLFSGKPGTTLQDSTKGKFLAANWSAVFENSFLCSPGLSGEFQLYSTGGNAPHNNMEPYQTVYIFKRSS